MIYSDLVAAISTYTEIDQTDVNLQTVLPRIIEQAENRIFRDIDFMIARNYWTTGITAGTATLAGPAGWLVGRYANTITGTARSALLRRDETFLQEVWPDRSAYTLGTVPKYWTELGVGTILIAPTADTAYTLELVYTARPAPISATNTTTWLATNCPDLLLYACMVAVTGYIKNFGAQADNPQMGLSWEQQYQTAKTNAETEESRRKGEAVFDAVTPAPSTTQTHGP